VRDSVETISANPVLFVKLIRQTIHIGDFRNGGMKRGIEAGNLFCAREFALYRLDACEVGRIMEGSQVCKLFN